MTFYHSRKIGIFAKGLTHGFGKKLAFPSKVLYSFQKAKIYSLLMFYVGNSFKTIKMLF